MAAICDQTSTSDEELWHEQQRQKIMDVATKQINALTGLEADYTRQVAAIVEERELQLREWQARFDADRKKAIDEEIRLNEAETQEILAALQLQLANKQLTQAGYDEAVYQAKQASLDRELALIKQENGEGSAE